MFALFAKLWVVGRERCLTPRLWRVRAALSEFCGCVALLEDDRFLSLVTSLIIVSVLGENTINRGPADVEETKRKKEGGG